ncbi:MAG: hypothetical protein PUC18_12860 [Prevotellaceae bacterium]|nr:hypothetical protein [Prevotellaceae bacterium]
MKASEIMVGDLLKYTTPSYIQVASITKKKIGYHIKPNEPRIHYVRLCEVNPIPLTPEILEKNGFIVCENTEIRHDYIWHDNKSYICVIFWNDGNLLVKMETNLNEGRGINSVHNCDIVFVHELQHCLRMCNINKTIEL